MPAMAAEEFVDVSYRGIEVGKQLKLIEFGPTTAYLEHPKPLPVGTQVELVAGGVQFSARVLRVNEQVAGAEIEAGMRLGVALEGDAKGWWEQQVSGEDPQIPEPVPPAVEAAVADSPPVLAEAAADADSAAVAVEPEAVPVEAESADTARPTLEMAAVEPSDSDVSTTEIEMVADEPEPEPAAPAPADEVPTTSHRKKRGPARTQIMSAVDIELALGAGGQEVVEDAVEAALADDDKPKKKKRRRRGRKRKTK